MSKKIVALLLAAIIVLGGLSGMTFAAGSTAEAAYGTPVVDGEIDSIWDTTNYYIVNNHPANGSEYYKGWFKVLWDENNLYVLAKFYGEFLNDQAGNPWECDSVDVYIDEKIEGQIGYNEDDYQIRSDFNGSVTGNNYQEEVKAGSKVIDEGFVTEIAFPLHTIALKEDLTIGFEVMMTAASALGVEMRTYNWNCTKNWLYNDTSCYGKLTLKKEVEVEPFDEPEYKSPELTTSVPANYVNLASYASVDEEIFEDVVTYFDDTAYQYPIMHINEYPAMAIEDLAAVIGGWVENGDTLVLEDNPKTLYDDSLRVTYTAGEQLATDEKGRLMLEREPQMYNGKLFIPVNTLINTVGWTVEYDRFNKKLDIRTGTNYPEPELVVYARDYGAVGDGIHDDRDAILEAVDIAIASGVPARVELDSDKTYLIEPRHDAQAFLLFENTKNITFDGKGSEILFAKAANSFLDIKSSTNIKITNVYVDYKEHVFTQGRVTLVDPENMRFRMIIDEGYPLPPAQDWVENLYVTESYLSGWSHGIIIDKTENRLKFNKYDEVFTTEVYPVEDGAEREYELIVKQGYRPNLEQMEVDDRYVLQTKFMYYDMGFTGLDGLLHGMVRIDGSGDISLENVTLYQTQWHSVNVGNCWGRIRLINFKTITRGNNLNCNNSDGIHYWQNRWGVIMDGCEMGANLDDQINCNGNTAYLRAVVSDSEDDGYVYAIDREIWAKSGDEIYFYDHQTREVLGTAFLKASKWVNGVNQLTLDRHIDGLKPGTASNDTVTKVYSVDCSSKASIIRNSIFKNCRRNGMLVQSYSVMYENNYIENMGGGAVFAKSEVQRGAGPSPSYFTFRNNKMKFDGQIQGNGPVNVQWVNNVLGDTPKIDCVLIENNYLDAKQKVKQISVSDVNRVWLKNNTIICTDDVSATHTPVVVSNSIIEELDGVTVDYTSEINAAVTIVGCELLDDVKNIVDAGGTATELCVIK